MDFIDDIIPFIMSPEIEGPLLLLKIFLIIYSFLFFIFIIWAHISSAVVNRFFVEDVVELATYKPYGIRALVKRWEKITKRLKTAIESEYKLAIIEAEIMLDDVLKEAGFAGETIGDRLKQLTPETLPNLEQVMETHKVRSSIIHDPDYRVTLDQARSILDIYEKAIKFLQLF